jgi:putative DNA primase/helicase
MAACSALGVVSLAMQGLADVRRSPTLTGPTSLYFLVVAESGDRKSTVDRLLSRAVNDYQDRQHELSKGTLATHTADLAAWEAKREATVSRMNGDAKSNKPVEGHKADLAALENGKPMQPRIPRLVYTDVTQEKLMRALANDWPSAGVFSSEAAAVFGGHSMGKDSIVRTLAAFNTLWDGGTHYVDRAQAASFAVRGARMTIALQVQPHVLADFLDRDRGLSRGSGFMARFLIAQPISMQGRRLYRETASTPEVDAFVARITELLEKVPRFDPERGLTPELLDLSPEAKATWISYYNSIEQQLATSGDFASVPDVAAKAADNIARMAAALHVFQFGPVGPIGAEAVNSAGQIVLWHLYNACALLTPLSVSKEDAAASSLDRWLVDRCRMEGSDGFSKTEIKQYGPNAVRKKEQLEKALDVLKDCGRVREVDQGRRQRRIVVNPALLSDPADPAVKTPQPGAPTTAAGL